MAFNERLCNRIREALEHIPHVEEKRMFGGVCFMVNGKMCIGVATGEMMCRIGPQAYEAALELPGCREMLHTGRPMNGYVFVSEDSLRTRKQLDYWVGLCLDFNQHAKASKKQHK